MFTLRDWFSTKKSEKDPEWANRTVRFIRMNMQPLVSREQAETGMAYLLGRQDLSYVRDLFQNPAKMNLGNEKRVLNHLGQPVDRHANHDDFLQNEMSAVNFKPLPLLEKPKNIQIAEVKKMGVVVEARSEDPASTKRRKTDEALLKYRKQIEKDLTEVFTKMGQQPYKLEQNEDRFGDKAGNGNIEAFDQMGLDDTDPSDINQFMQHFHKLMEEMAAQDVIDFSMTYNQVLDKMENWTNDIWAKKAIAACCHVSDVTGALMYDYLAPETVYIYGGGRRKDYNDANAKAYQQKVSVKELLDRFGSALDMDKDWDKILQAISYAGNNTEFTGIGASWRGLCDGKNFGEGPRRFGINEFLAFKVTIGYIEWTSQNQETFGEVNKGKEGEENNQSQGDEKYPTKARFETPTYKAFYLASSEVDQTLFNFGEATYQQIEGYSDFNVNFTIVTFKEIGDPLAIMAIPFIDVIHEAWFKWKYELRRAKPRGTDYNYDSLVTIAEDLMGDQEISKEGKLQKMLSLMDSSANGLWTFPIGPDGKPVMFSAAQLNPDKPNGLTPEIGKWWEIIVNTMDEMQDVLTGKAPLRSGDPGGSRDSMNNQFKALEYSQNATYYVPDMLTGMFQQLAVKSMLFVCDIVQYKKFNTLAFNFLADGIGEDKLMTIMGLGKKAMHRYGIFVESLNQSAARAKLSARIDFALQNGKISNAQALLVEDIKSPKKAFLWLAYFEDRTIKMQQKNALEAQKQQQQGAMQLEQAKQQTIKMQIDGMILGKQIDADAEMQSHIINQSGGIAKTAMKHSSDVEQIERTAQLDLQGKSNSIDQTGKVNPPPPAPPQVGRPAPANGPAPQPQRPLSGIQESMRDSQPMATSAGV